MKLYENYNESGVEWIPQIPSDWSIIKLKFVAETSFSSVDRHEYKSERAVSICHYPNAYKNERINSSTFLSVGTCTESEFEKFQLKEGQVIITKDSESANDIGIPTYVEETVENGVCGYHLAILTPNKHRLIGEFLFRYLQTKSVGSFFETNSNGVTRFGLGKPIIENLPVIIPSIEEQTKITKFLSHQAKLIDTLITKKEQLIEKLKEQRQAIINEAVTKGLNPNVKMKDSGIAWLGEIPEHWKTSKLKWNISFLNNKRIPIDSVERNSRKGNYPYYGASGIIDYVDDFIFDGGFILVGEDGANILARSSPLAFMAYGKYWVNNHAHILDMINGVNEYFCEQLELNDFSTLASGSAQPKLTKEALGNLKIVVPPFEEQKDIKQKLDIIKTKFEELLQQNKASINQLKSYRQSLISEAVTGKTDVRDWQVPTNN